MKHPIMDASAARRDAITDERRRAITARIRWVAQHARSLALYTDDDREPEARR